jgi:adenylate cyclase
MSERILHLAERLDDTDMKIEGSLMMGYNLAFRENPKIGLEHIEKGIALYHSQRQRERRLGIGTNPGVVGLTVSALFLWMRGYPDHAQQRAADAILLARKLNHPYSLTYTHFHHGLLHMWLKNHETAGESAQTVLQLSEVHGFQIWSAIGSCLRGAALVGTGQNDPGLALIDQGLNAYRGLKTPPVFWPLLLHLCAGAYGTASRPGDGFPLLDEAIEVASARPSTSETLTSEFLILKGDLLLASSSDHAVEAETLYQNAVNIAQEGYSPMLELRAAIRLSRLWQGQGKKEQARKLLSDVYSKFTEGFTTADLKEANALLDALSS